MDEYDACKRNDSGVKYARIIVEMSKYVETAIGMLEISAKLSKIKQ